MSGPRQTDPGAGGRLLDRLPPEGYRKFWTEHFARPPMAAEDTPETAMLFRLGEEWLALPAAWVGEVVPARAMHSLPHRREGALAGIVNVRGELLPCVALEPLLGLEPAKGPSAASRRLLVAGRGARRVVFAADEIFGMWRYGASAVLPAPAKPVHVETLLKWKERTVGLLNPETVWPALERSLA